jgi:hypothetical protein
MNMVVVGVGPYVSKIPMFIHWPWPTRSIEMEGSFSGGSVSRIFELDLNYRALPTKLIVDDRNVVFTGDTGIHEGSLNGSQSFEIDIVRSSHFSELAPIYECNYCADENSNRLNNMSGLLPPFEKFLWVGAGVTFLGIAFVCCGLFLFFSGIHTGDVKLFPCLLSLFFAFIFSSQGVTILAGIK